MSFYIIINNTFGIQHVCVCVCVCVCATENGKSSKTTRWFGANSRRVLEHIKKYSASYFNLSVSRKPGIFLGK